MFKVFAAALECRQPSFNVLLFIYAYISQFGSYVELGLLLIRNRLKWINNNIHQPKFVCEDANVTEDLTKKSLVGDYGARYDLTKT